MFNCGGIIKYERENCVESGLDRIYLGSELTMGKLCNFDGKILLTCGLDVFCVVK